MGPRYSISKKSALHFTRNGRFKSAIHGAIKSLNHDHPEHKISNDAARSLVKRISGQLRETFARLLVDRMMLTWLEEHRDDWDRIGKLRGGLRNVVEQEMLREEREEDNSQETPA